MYGGYNNANKSHKLAIFFNRITNRFYLSKIYSKHTIYNSFILCKLNIDVQYLVVGWADVNQLLFIQVQHFLLVKSLIFTTFQQNFPKCYLHICIRFHVLFHPHSVHSLLSYNVRLCSVHVSTSDCRLAYVKCVDESPFYPDVLVFELFTWRNVCISNAKEFV